MEHEDSSPSLEGEGRVRVLLTLRIDKIAAMDKKLFPPRKIKFARALRREPTKWEHRMWFQVSDRKLGGLKFRRQCAVGHYIADFACLEAKLVVEIDGPQHGERLGYDAARTRFLEKRGYQVLRFAVEHVAENLNGVLEVIAAAAAERRRTLTLPSPSKEGEE